MQGASIRSPLSHYVYDAANRLASVSDGVTISSYVYSGLGDRLQQAVNSMTTTYTLDLNTGLTQVIQDGTYTYLYGNGRISQVGETAEYFLGDALGSVRQMVDEQAEVVYAAVYSPYGELIAEEGTAQTSYGYTGEMEDSS